MKVETPVKYFLNFNYPAKQIQMHIKKSLK